MRKVSGISSCNTGMLAYFVESNAPGNDMYVTKNED